MSNNVNPGPTPTPAPTPDPTPAPTPSAATIKNVIVVVMQNRSFDNLFGEFPLANGITPSGAGFSQQDKSGKTVTPFVLTDLATADFTHTRGPLLNSWDNGLMDKFAFTNGDNTMGHYDATTMGTLWGWAQQFALADNFFPSAMGDAPSNQLMLVAADDNQFPFSVQPFFGPCNTGITTKQPYTFQHVGDQLASKGLTWAWYHEKLNQCGNYVSQENPFQFFTDSHGTPNVKDLSAFSTDLASGNFPAVAFVQSDARHDMHPALGVPVTEGITWLDGFLKSIQASPIWNNAAVVVVWDSSGGWYDHVPPPQMDPVPQFGNQGLGIRVPMMVISPLSKKNYISHVQMDDVSILQFIQKTFGLPPLNARNQLGNDISDMFQF
jgi:phospholipase C